MDDIQNEIFESYRDEVMGLLDEIKVGDEGEHLWDSYQKVIDVIFRLGEMHNEIADMEITGRDWPEIKKFRTLIIDPTIDRLEKVAAFESRKITARGMEKDLERY